MAERGRFAAKSVLAVKKRLNSAVKCIRVAAKCISQKYQQRTLKPIQMNIERPPSKSKKQF